jgi:hypothetical protein
MYYKGAKVEYVSISYKVNGNRATVDSTPVFASKMMAGLERDGATNVHILHYFDKNLKVIK